MENGKNITKVAKKTLILMSLGLAIFTRLDEYENEKTVDAAGEREVTIVFPANASRTPSKSVVIPGLSKVTSVSTNTGSVTHSVSGTTVTLRPKDGAYVSRTWSDKALSKAVTNSRTASTNSFPATNAYNSGGYAGTLNKSGSATVISGSYTAAHTKAVTGQTSASYNSGGYKGTLTKYVHSGSASQSKTVTGQTSANYNSGGYTGTLTRYVHSGSASASRTQSWTERRTQTYEDWGDGTSWTNKSSTGGTTPSSVWYSTNGYTGTLYRTSTSSSTKTSYNYNLTPWRRYRAVTRTSSYSGTVKTADTRVYRYKGTVRTKDTRVYRYKGNVTKPASDTRTWRQNYSGTAYQGGYINYRYAYAVTVRYNRTDTVAPTATVKQSTTAITKGPIDLTLTAKDGLNDVASITSTNGGLANNANYGKNLLKDSGRRISNATYNIAQYPLLEPISHGEQVTLTIKGTLASTKTRFSAYNSGGSVHLVNLVAKGGGIYEGTFNWKVSSGSTFASNTRLYIYQMTSAQAGTSTIEWIKLERGNRATPYTPSPESEAKQNLINESNSAISTGSKNLTYGINPQDLRGKQVTVSIDVDLVGAAIGTTRGRLGMEPAIRFTDGTVQYIGAWHRPANGANFNGRISNTVTVQDKAISGWAQTGMYVQIGGTRTTIRNPKLEIGGRTPWKPSKAQGNLAPESKISTWGTAYTKVGRAYVINGTQSGLKIDTSGLKINTNYVLSFKMKKNSGTIGNIAGHQTFFTARDVFIDGNRTGSTWSSGNTFPNNTQVHEVKVHLKTLGTRPSDPNLYIQPNRGNYGATFNADISDVYLEERPDFEQVFKVSANGTYNFRVTDTMGNSRTVSHSVTNIDVTPPTGTITGNPTAWTKNNPTLRITGTDTQSGMKRVRLPNGTWVNGATGSQAVSANGTYSFILEDNQGNQRTVSATVNRIDKTVPNGTITGNPTAWTKNNVTLTFNATDSGGAGVKRVRQAGGTWVTGATTTRSVSANGTYSFEVEDNATNVRTVSVAVNRIDKTLPTGTISGNPTAWTNQSVMIRVAPSDAGGSGYKHLVMPNGVPNSSTNPGYTATANGTYNFTLHDNAGNTRVVSAVVNRIDKTLPTVTANVGSRAWGKANQSVTLTFADSQSGVSTKQYAWSTSTATPTTWTTYSSAVTQSANGTWYLHARVVDVAGNVRTQRFGPYRIDKTVPNGTITGNPTAWTKNNATLTFNATDTGGSGVKRVRQAGGTWVTGATTTMSVSANGTYSFEVEDNATNVRTVSVAVNRIDKTLPTVTANVASRAWGKANQSVTLTFADSQSGVPTKQYAWSTSTTTPTTWTTYSSAVTQSANGTWYLHARVVDGAGNVRTQRFGPYRIDKTVPNGTISGNPTAWTKNNVTLTFNATDTGGSGVKRVRQAGGTWVTGATTTRAVSANGTYSFEVEDNATNVRTVSVAVNRIDKTLPTVSANVGSRAWGNANQSVTLTFADSQSGVPTKQYAWSTSTATPTSWTTYSSAVTQSANGTWYLHARVVDGAGNVRTQRFGPYRVDKTKPTIAVNTASRAWSSANVSVTMTHADALSGIPTKQYAWSTSTTTPTSWTNYTGAVTQTATGTWYLHGRAVDGAGNVHTQRFGPYRIDKTIPNISATRSTSAWTNKPVNLTINGSDAHSGLKDIQMISKPEKGVNLIRNSAKLTTAGSNAAGITRAVNASGNLEITAASGNGNYASNLGMSTSATQINSSVTTGQTVTFSFEIRSDNSTAVPTFYFGPGMGYYQMNGRTSKEWSTVSITRAWSATSWNPHLGFSGKVGKFEIRNAKLEIGEGTPWTPAPEDIALSSSRKVYPVVANGTYNFRATDNSGNVKDLAVSVTNIDTTNPNVSSKKTPSTWTNKEVAIDVAATDSGSGISTITQTNQSTNIGRNFVRNSQLNYRTASLAWNTSLNGTLVPNGSWSSGYNGGVSSPAVGYHAHLNISEFGYPVLRYVNKNSTHGHTNRWMGVSQAFGATSALGKELKVGQKVTVSYDLYSDKVGGTIHGGLYRVRKSTGTNAFVATNYTRATKANTWERVSYTQTVDSDWDLTKSFSIYLYGNSNDGEATKYVRNFKVELGDTATPYTNAPEDVSVGSTNLLKQNDSIGSYASYNPAWSKKDANTYETTLNSGYLTLQIPALHTTVRGGGYTFSGYLYVNDKPIPTSSTKRFSTYYPTSAKVEVREDGYFVMEIPNHTTTWIFHMPPANIGAKIGDKFTLKYPKVQKGTVEQTTPYTPASGDTGLNADQRTFKVAENGTYTFQAADVAGNKTDHTVSVTNIDRVLPNGTISGNPTAWTKNNVTLTFNATDSGGSGVKRVRQAGGSWVNGSRTTRTVTANGTYSFEVEDNAGNTRTVSATVNRIDKTVPNGTISGNPTAWTKNNVTLTFNATDSGGSGVKRVRQAGGTWVTGARTTRSVSANGTYSFEVEDNATNVRTVSVTVNRIDKTLPTGTISGNPTAWTKNNATLTFNATDTGGSGVKRVRQAGGTWVTGATTTMSVSANGTYSFEVEDNATNVRTVSVAVNRIDKTLPTVTANVGSRAWGKANQSVTLTFADSQSGVATKQYAWSTSTATPTAWTTYSSAVTQSANGTWYLHARVVDVAGNVRTQRFGPYRIDKTLPSGTISGNPTAWTKNNVTLTFNATDAGGSGVKRVRQAGGTWVTGATTTMSVSANGTYSFEVEDNATNVRTVSVTVNRIDKALPNGTITGNPTAWTNQNATLTFNATDTGGSGVKRVRQAGGTWVTGSTTTRSVSANGTYSFEVEDNATNVRTVSVTVNRIDKVKPENKGATVHDARYVSGNDHWIRPGDKFRVDVSGYDAHSQMRYSYLRFSGDGNDNRAQHDWNAADGHVNEFGITGGYTNITAGSRVATGTSPVYRFNAQANTTAGNRTFQVHTYFTDKAGNIVGYVDTGKRVRTDETAPTITANTGSRGWGNSNVSVTLTHADAQSGIKTKQYKWSTSTTTPTSWDNYTGAVTQSATGTWYLHARAEDNVGRVTTQRFGPYRIDKTLPNGTISGNPTAWTNQNATLTFNATDTGGSGVRRVRQAGGTWVAGSRTTRAVSANGTYSFEVEDNAGNVRTVSVTVNRIDKTLPNGSVSGNPTAWTNKDVTLTFNGTDAGGAGVKRVRQAGGTWVTGATTTRAVSANGTYSFEVEDNAGNTRTVSVTVNRIDKAIPNGTISGNPTAWTKNNATLTFSATDTGGSGVKQVRQTAGTWVAGSTTTRTVSANGTYSFEVEDNAGNTRTVSVTVNRIDKVLPTVSANPASRGWANTNVSVTLTHADALSGIATKQYAWSTSTATPTAWSDYTGAVTQTANGTWYLHARAVDNAGNVHTQRFGPYRVDKTKPTISVNSSSRAWGNTNVSVTMTHADALSGVGTKQYAWSTSTTTPTSWTNYTGAVTQTATGTWYLHGRVVDNAGNVHTQRFGPYRIDKTLPNGVISGNATAWTNKDVTLTFNATDSGGSGVKRVRTSGGTWVNGSTTTRTVSSNGTYGFEVEDNAGNVRTVNITVNRIDKSIPTLSIGGNPTQWQNTDATLSINASDTGGSGVKHIVLPNGNIVSQSSASYTVTTNGNYTFKVVDVAGNERSYTVKVDKIDKVDPTANVVANTTAWTNQNVTLTITSTDTQSGIREIVKPDGTKVTTTSTTFVATSNGTYTFKVTDVAGNTTEKAYTVSNIDKEPPSETIIEIEK